MVRKWLAFLLAVVVFFTIHEGLHALIAESYGEYEEFIVKPIGEIFCEIL